MLFAGDRNIIGFLQSYPPKPIYGDAGLTAFAVPMDKPGAFPGQDKSKERHDEGWPPPAPLAPKLANKIVGYEDWTIDGPPEQGPIPSLRNTRSIDQGKLKSLMDELADMRLRGVL